MKLIVLILLMLLMGFACATGCIASWDYMYDGNALPNDSSLGADKWTIFSGTDCSRNVVGGGILHVIDARNDASVDFFRFSVPASSPITVEARVRIGSGDGTMLVAGTPSYATYMALSIDHVNVQFAPDRSATSYQADLSAFRTIRVAIDAQGTSWVWLDRALLCRGITSEGNQGGIQFGSLSTSGLNDSYWDYIAYSADFLPVPEPASILTLAGAFVGFAGLAMRRCR